MKKKEVHAKICAICDKTDMRKGIDGLAAVVSEHKADELFNTDALMSVYNVYTVCNPSIQFKFYSYSTLMPLSLRQWFYLSASAAHRDYGINNNTNKSLNSSKKC